MKIRPTGRQGEVKVTVTITDRTALARDPTVAGQADSTVLSFFVEIKDRGAAPE